MRKNLSFTTLALFGVAAGLMHVGQAQSATLHLDYETTSPDGASIITTTMPGYDGINVLSSSGSYTYDNTVAQNTRTVPGNSSTTDEFFDDYVFSISGDAIGSSITATIKLGSSYLITDLQVRLIKLADGSYQTITGQVTAPNTVLNAWTTAIGTAGAAASFSEESLSAGTYILQVRGLASGTSGGVYTGSLELTPVPLPAAAWLLLSGLVGLTGIRRRR